MPFLLVIKGDFNTKCQNCYNYDKINFEDSLDGLTNQFSLQQLIHKLTHTLENSTSSCDLILTNQQNVAFTFHCIQNIIIKSNLPNPILKSFTHLRMTATFDIIKEQIMIKLDGLLMNLHGIDHLLI